MKDGFIKVACATCSIRVADPVYNAEQIAKVIKTAEKEHVKLLALPELCLTGYTCGDLFAQTTLIEKAKKQLEKLASKVGDMLVVIGCPIDHAGKLYNCAAVLNQGRILGIVPKTHLPSSHEFYEIRNFVPAPEEKGKGTTSTVLFGGKDLSEAKAIPFGSGLLFQCNQMKEMVVGVEICEDLWVADPPSSRAAMAGATVIVNPSASDETIGKEAYRRNLVVGQSGRLYAGYLYADAGDGESTTDMVFAGHNLIAENGNLLRESKLFENGMIITELDLQRLVKERQCNSSWKPSDTEGFTILRFDLKPEKTSLTRPIDKNPFVPADTRDRVARCESILRMQTEGLKKRIDHTHAQSLVIGLSGGLDSTLALLVACGAMDRLGRDRSDILAVTMPCFGTTGRTKGNAGKLAQSLHVTLKTVDIKKAVDRHFLDIGHDKNVLDVTYENSQARERTQVLMDIANQEGGLVIGTGDLSELALGWATYNGDHMSMYAVNTSIPKTLVRHIVDAVASCPSLLANDAKDQKQLQAVLKDILDTPVSPELLPAKDGEIAQKTEELVGPYELHDFFLYYVLRFGFSPAKIDRLARTAFRCGLEDELYDAAAIRRWMHNFYRRFFAQQFKRSCLPDGPKVGSVTLSPRGDWKMPSDAQATIWLDEIEKLDI